MHGMLFCESTFLAPFVFVSPIQLYWFSENRSIWFSAITVYSPGYSSEVVSETIRKAWQRVKACGAFQFWGYLSWGVFQFWGYPSWGAFQWVRSSGMLLWYAPALGVLFLLFPGHITDPAVSSPGRLFRYCLPGIYWFRVFANSSPKRVHISRSAWVGWYLQDIGSSSTCNPASFSP